MTETHEFTETWMKNWDRNDVLAAIVDLALKNYKIHHDQYNWETHIGSMTMAHKLLFKPSGDTYHEFFMWMDHDRTGEVKQISYKRAIDLVKTNWKKRITPDQWRIDIIANLPLRHTGE